MLSLTSTPRLLLNNQNYSDQNGIFCSPFCRCRFDQHSALDLLQNAWEQQHCCPGWHVNCSCIHWWVSHWGTWLFRQFQWFQKNSLWKQSRERRALCIPCLKTGIGCVKIAPCVSMFYEWTHMENQKFVSWPRFRKTLAVTGSLHKNSNNQKNSSGFQFICCL